MRKIVITLLTALCVSNVAGQTKWTGAFQLEVTGPSTTNGTYLYLTYSAKGTLIIDSAKFAGGKAVIKGEVREPGFASLSLSKPPLIRANVPATDRRSVILEKGVIALNLKQSLSNATVEGSEINRDWDAITGALRTYEHKALGSEPGMIKGNENRSAVMDSVYARLRQKEIPELILQYRKSPAALFLLNQQYAYFMDTVAVAPLYRELPNEITVLSMARNISFRLDKIRKMDRLIGNLAPEISLPDTLGKHLNVSSFRGKYVLLDFWASWCQPCREESPSLVRAYQQLKERNFTMVSISLDRAVDREKWINAIQHDGLSWTQLIDQKNQAGQTAADAYGILAIPQNFLIDPNGRIIAKGLRGEQLLEELSKLIRP